MTTDAALLVSPAGRRRRIDKYVAIAALSFRQRLDDRAVLVGRVMFYAITPIFLIWQKLAFVLGGLMLPIGIYPDWLRLVAEHTPFAALLYGPGQLVVQGSAGNTLGLLLTLAAWGALFLMVVALLERRARRNVCLHGG